MIVQLDVIYNSITPISDEYRNTKSYLVMKWEYMSFSRQFDTMNKL